MKLDFGIAKIRVPDARYVPTLIVGVGREDATSAPTMAAGSGSGRGQRRSLTVNFAPLPHDASGEEVIAAELNKLLRGANAKLINSEDKTMHGNPGRLVEIHFAGPAGVAMTTLVFIGFGEGFLQTFMLTAMDGDHFEEVRGDFEAIISSIELGDFFNR